MSAKRTNPDRTSSVMDPIPDEAIEAAKSDQEKSGEKTDLKNAIEALKKNHEEAGKALEEIARLGKGEVGGEKNVKLTDAERAENDWFKVEIEDAVDASRVLKLVGSIEDQKEALSDFTEKALKNDFDIASAKDKRLYRRVFKLYNKEAFDDSKMKVKDKARLEKIEGPSITPEVLAKMSAGETAWTVNGAYAALNLLRAGRLPATGEPPTAADAAARAAAKDADIIDMKTGKKMTAIEIAAAAALAGGALGGGRSPDVAPSEAEKTEAEYNAAQAERDKLLVEIGELDDDNSLFRDLAQLPPGAKRDQMLEENLPMISDYLRLSDASASIEDIKAILPGITDPEAENFKKNAEKLTDAYYFEHVATPMLALKGGARTWALEKAFNRALLQAEKMRNASAERAAALKTKILEMERTIIDSRYPAAERILTRDINASEARLAKIRDRIKENNASANENRRVTPRTEQVDEKLGDLLYEAGKLEEAETKEADILAGLVAQRERITVKTNDRDDDRSFADYAGGTNDEYERNEAATDELEPAEPAMRVAADIDEASHDYAQDLDQHEMVKEARREVRDILAARKSGYTAGIDSGAVTREELEELKARLISTGPKKTLKKVLTSSKNESLRLGYRELKAIEPLSAEIFQEIVRDTDELIALAKKSSASEADEKPIDIDAELAAGLANLPVVEKRAAPFSMDREIALFGEKIADDVARALEQDAKKNLPIIEKSLTKKISSLNVALENGPRPVRKDELVETIAAQLAPEGRDDAKKILDDYSRPELLGFVNKLIDELSHNLQYAKEYVETADAAAKEPVPTATTAAAEPKERPEPPAAPTSRETTPVPEPVEAAEDETTISVKKSLKKSAEKFDVALPDTLTRKQIRDIKSAIDVFYMQDPAIQNNKTQLRRVGDKLHEISKNAMSSESTQIDSGTLAEKKFEVTEHMEMTARTTLPEVWYKFANFDEGTQKGGVGFLESHLKDRLGTALKEVRIHPDNSSLAIVTIEEPGQPQETFAIPISDSARNVMGLYDGATGFKPIARIDQAAILDPKTLKMIKKGSLST